MPRDVEGAVARLQQALILEYLDLPTNSACRQLLPTFSGCFECRPVESELCNGPRSVDTSYVTERDEGLLAQISSEVFNEDVSVALLLQKCLTLATQAGSTKMRDWVLAELRGYQSYKEAPLYRAVVPATLAATVEIDGPDGPKTAVKLLSKSDVTAYAALESDWAEIAHMPIRDIETWAAEGSKRFAVNDTVDAVAHLQSRLDASDEGVTTRVLSVYKHVGQDSLARVVYKLRVSLAELLSEMIMETPEDKQVPAREVVDRAMHIAVEGKGNTVTLINSHASDGSLSSVEMPPPSTSESWWQRWRKRGVVVGVSTFLAAVAGLAVWLEWTPWK